MATVLPSLPIHPPLNHVTPTLQQQLYSASHANQLLIPTASLASSTALANHQFSNVAYVSKPGVSLSSQVVIKPGTSTSTVATTTPVIPIHQLPSTMNMSQMPVIIPMGYIMYHPGSVNSHVHFSGLPPTSTTLNLSLRALAPPPTLPSSASDSSGVVLPPPGTGKARVRTNSEDSVGSSTISADSVDNDPPTAAKKRRIESRSNHEHLQLASAPNEINRGVTTPQQVFLPNTNTGGVMVAAAPPSVQSPSGYTILNYPMNIAYPGAAIQIAGLPAGSPSSVVTSINSTRQV